MALPYLTRDFPGIDGTIKQRPDDFFVQEIPLYEPSGSGEHVYCEIQKVELTTLAAIDQIARALGVSTRDIGYAGLKDTNAVTRQVISILGTSPEAVMALKIPNLTIHWAARHGNKLRLGHLKGNRFAVRIRDVNPTDVVRLRPMLDILERRGMPNFFGEQRFGRRNNNDQLGATLIRGRPEELLEILLGSPDASLDDPQSLQARTHYSKGDLAGSMQHWPRRSGMERRVLARLIKTGKPGAAVKSIDERLRRLWMSALQSRLFNEVAERRIDELDRLMLGDLAYKHENGACFRVEDVAAEQPRCDAFEISPTGPLVGYRMSEPGGTPHDIETAAFKAHGLTRGHFRQEGRDHAKGARRPLRVKPTDLDLEGGVDQFGAHITVAFTLPAGSYATVLLRELMKKEVIDQVDSPVAPDVPQTSAPDADQ